MLKCLKNENLFSGIRLVYIITTIVYSLARQNITALQPYLMSDILNVIVIGVAAVLVLWDVIIFKNIWKTKYISILIAFVGLTVISSIVGFKYGYIENIKALANLFIQFFLLFVVSVKKDSAALKKEVCIISNAVGVFWFVPAIISLYMYFADITYTGQRLLWGESVEIVQGFVREHDGAVVMRLWGVFVDPNFASAISIAIVTLCIFVILNSKNKFIKLFNVINIVVQVLYIVLSNSRMALLICCLSVFVGVWYYAYFLLKEKKFNLIVKEFISVVMAIVCTVACFASVQLIKNTLPYIRYGIEYVDEKIGSDVDETAETSTETTTEQTTTEPTTAENTSVTTTVTTTVVPSTEQNITETIAVVTIDNTTAVVTPVLPVDSTESTTVEETTTKTNVVEKLERVDAAVKTDKTNGRFDLWMEGINAVFKPNPIFGVGPRNYNVVANHVNPDLKISNGFSIHNSYVELLMGNGALGTIVLALFFIICAFKAISVRYKDTRKAKSVGILMVGVLAILACGMFIACLFYTLSGATIIMFTFLGYAVRIALVDEK